MTASSPRTRTAFVGSTLIAAAALGTVVIPTATPLAAADPTPWSFNVSSVSAGVASGGELALDSERRQLFITDNDFVLTTKGKDFTVQARQLDPKVTAFDIDRNRPVSAIRYAGQPWGVMPFGPVPVLPTPQVPDGIALDTVNHRVVTSNSHANGITVARMSARQTGPSNLISDPQAHPMGVAVDGAAHRAYVAMNSKNSVVVIDTLTGKKVGEIADLFAASFVEVDAARHRLYVGNADYQAKKNNFVAVVDTRTGTVIRKIVTPSNSRPKVDASTGRVFVASFDTGKISVIDPDSLKITDTIETKSSPNKLAIDVGRRLVYAANLQKRTVSVIDADTLQPIATVPVKAPISSIAVDPKTGTVYGTVHQSGKLIIVSPAKS